MPKKPGKKKRPSSFTEFWHKLLRKDKKKGADEVTDKTVQKAMSKVAKVLPLKKKEQKQVTSVLAAEMQQIAHEKQHTAHCPSGPVKEGDDVYPVARPTGLFTQEELDERQKETLERGDSISLASENEAAEADVPVVGTPAPAGKQPDSITLDRDAVKEIQKHMLVSMLQEVMLEASIRQQSAAPNQKRAEEMNPDELIELRKTNLQEWESVVKENTVVSYALSKPNTKEVKKAQKIKEKKKEKRKPLQFDDNVEVAKAPVGKDFLPNESKSNSTTTLKRK